MSSHSLLKVAKSLHALAPSMVHVPHLLLGSSSPVLQSALLPSPWPIEVFDCVVFAAIWTASAKVTNLESQEPPTTSRHADRPASRAPQSRSHAAPYPVTPVLAVHPSIFFHSASASILAHLQPAARRCVAFQFISPVAGLPLISVSCTTCNKKCPTRPTSAPLRPPRLPYPAFHTVVGITSAFYFNTQRLSYIHLSASIASHRPSWPPRMHCRGWSNRRIHSRLTMGPPSRVLLSRQPEPQESPELPLRFKNSTPTPSTTPQIPTPILNKLFLASCEPTHPSRLDQTDC